MRYLIILTITTLAVGLMGFDLQPVNVARNIELSPPARMESSSPDSLIIETTRSRNIVTFDFPEGYFGEDNLIIEAILEVEIEELPSMSTEECVPTPIELICLPLTSRVGESPLWSSVESAYNMAYAEAGIYIPERRRVFFEISRMLYAANEGEIEFHGVMIVPAVGSRNVRILDREASVELRSANLIGARATRD